MRRGGCLWREGFNLTCFHASSSPLFCLTPAGHPSSSPFLDTVSPSKSALFCRARGIAQSLARGSFRIDLSTMFGQKIPSRYLREKRSVMFFFFFFLCLLKFAPRDCQHLSDIISILGGLSNQK